MSTKNTRLTEHLSIRLSPAQRALVNEAAAKRRRRVTDFMRDAGLEEARMALLPPEPEVTAPTTTTQAVTHASGGPSGKPVSTITAKDIPEIPRDAPRGWQSMANAPAIDNMTVMACIEGEASDCYVEFYAGEWRDANGTPVKPVCWRHYDRRNFQAQGTAA